MPQTKGVEKRKSEPSKEGLLGVEGMETELLYGLLRPFSNKNGGEAAQRLKKIASNPLKKVDLYIDGLTGGENSAARRDEVAKKFGLPEGMSAGALLEALRAVASYEEYLAAVGREENTTED